MRTSIAIKRYGKALYELGLETKNLEGFLSDMTTLMALVKEVPFFLKSISDERIARERRHRLIDEIAKSSSLCIVAISLVKLLVDKSRVSLLPFIVEDVVLRLKRHKKLASASVVVADGESAHRVRDGVEMIIGRALGTKVECETEIDKSILGGFIVSFGDVQFDASIKGKLDRMREKILEFA